MQDYVIPGGRFANAFAALAATGWKLNLESAHRPGEQRGGARAARPSSPAPAAVRIAGASLI